MKAQPRYLVIAPQGLGDALQATPFIGALRAAHEHARIDVAVTRSGPKMLFGSLDGVVDEVLYLPYWERGKAHFIGELVKHLTRRRYDASFLMYPAARLEYQALLRAFPSRLRLSHRYHSGWLERLIPNVKFVDVGAKGNALRNADLLPAAGIVEALPNAYLVPPAWKSDRREDDRIAIHAGSINHDGFSRKRWPIGHFAELARRWQSRGYRVSVIAGPDERDISQALCADVSGVEPFEGSLVELARFLSTCKLVISNDTGVAHLSAAVGTPVAVLFGPTPIECGPYGPSVLKLRPSQCPPCFTPQGGIPDCPRGLDYMCLKRDLNVDYVDERVRDFIRQFDTMPSETSASRTEIARAPK